VYRERREKMRKLLLCLAVVVLGTGCAGIAAQMPSPVDLDKYETLGEGVGSATGIMLFGVIPINQNQRFWNAYNAAVNSRRGEKLLNPVISERWFYGVVLYGFVTTVSGTVVREKF